MRRIASILISFLILCSITALTTEASAQEKKEDLADKIVGTYIGKLESKKGATADYKVKVTKISPTKIKVQPVTGTESQTAEIVLTKVMMGNLETIALRVPGNKMKNNGSYIGASNLLAYVIHLGGEDDRNLEVFRGKKTE